MKRTSWARGALLLALLAGCGEEASRVVRPYAYNDLQLLSRYTAKEACSCLFVMEMDEAYCRAWVVANPPVATFSFDKEEKTVDSSVLLLWGGHARFIDDQLGCQLDD